MPRKERNYFSLKNEAVFRDRKRRPRGSEPGLEATAGQVRGAGRRATPTLRTAGRLSPGSEAPAGGAGGRQAATGKLGAGRLGKVL